MFIYLAEQNIEITAAMASKHHCEGAQIFLTYRRTQQYFGTDMLY